MPGTPLRQLGELNPFRSLESHIYMLEAHGGPDGSIAGPLLQV
jgi:hypothetical protein